MYCKSNFGVVLLCLIVLGCTSTKKVTEPNTVLDDMVKNKTIKIKVNTAEPMVTAAMAEIANSGMMAPGNSASRINVRGDGYFIEINGDTVSADLPYFGERQMGGGYGEDGGIKFNEKASDFKISRDDVKYSNQLRFNVTEKTETYMVTMDISPNWDCIVRINSSYRNPISFSGTVVEQIE